MPKPIAIMILTRICLLIISLLASIISRGQDTYPGKWRMVNEKIPFEIELEIAHGKHNLLYPARLTIKHNRFSGEYAVLLVRKNSRQLAVGMNKIALDETPFSIHSLPFLINGTLDLTFPHQSAPVLQLNRMEGNGIASMAKAGATETNEEKEMIKTINLFLLGEPVKLIKTDTTALQDDLVNRILNTDGPDYFGVMDTMQVYNRDGTVSFPGNKKINSGIVSGLLRNNYMFEYAYLTSKKPYEEIRLDTGLNYMVLFADAYGKSPAATGRMQAVFGKKTSLFDFSEQKNAGATFIVQPFYIEPPLQDNDAIQQTIIQDLKEQLSMVNDSIYYYPVPGKPDGVDDTKINKEVAAKTLLRDAKLVGNVQAISRQVLLAIWDDAVEDGDSISLNINGSWVVQGLPVRKRPQYISVMLNPGANSIIFIADNQGTIIPNTSLLEIIDGRQRKSFKIDTDYSRNNLINIIYEVKH